MFVGPTYSSTLIMKEIVKGDFKYPQNNGIILLPKKDRALV